MDLFIESSENYNNNDPIGEWFSLPIDLDNMRHTLFGNTQSGEGEYMITATENIPFDVDEDESISVLNDVYELVESSINKVAYKNITSGEYNVTDLINLAINTNMPMDLIDHFVSADDVVEHLQPNLDVGDILSVKAQLEDISPSFHDEKDYFYLGNDRNFTSITQRDLKNTLDAIFEAIFLDVVS